MRMRLIAHSHLRQITNDTILSHYFTWDVFNLSNAELNPIRHLLPLVGARHIVHVSRIRVNTLNAELNPIRHLLALVGARHIVHVSRIGLSRFTSKTLYFTGCVSVSIGGIFLQIRTPHSPLMHYKRAKSFCDQSIIEGSLHEEQCTLPAVSPLQF